MTEFRIKSHPILAQPSSAEIPFYWQKQPLKARPDETIASALIANGITVFGHHPKDGSPQGIFCANGQCAQCMVIANRLPVKACMTSVKPGMEVYPAEGLFSLPEVAAISARTAQAIPILETDVLIIGGGPAGLSAALELGKLNIRVLLIDDKARLGGKLVLQTHRFFGSTETVFAGTRGIDIATMLAAQVRAQASVEVWENSTAVAIFEDQSIGIFGGAEAYCLVKPAILLVASGAREKSLAFPGNTLPGVYGAGAFQTLVNRDLVKPCENLFIVGGGNVGLIAGYHAIQAGIHVAGLVEAAQRCGGYKVHLDKLARSGVPIYTSHTVVEARGAEVVEEVLISALDPQFRPIAGSERKYACDTLLIAVGLDPVNEFIHKAEEVGLPVFSAGDAHEIAEASAAIFSGKIVAAQIAAQLGQQSQSIPAEWFRTEEILKSRPGAISPEDIPDLCVGVFPVFHCHQEIPCDPCANVCPKDLIHVSPDDIRSLPEFQSYAASECIGCLRCVAVCPGLAISLVDFRKSAEYALVSLPFEMNPDLLQIGSLVAVTDTEGKVLGELPVESIRHLSAYFGTSLVTVRAPQAWAAKIAGIKLIPSSQAQPFESEIQDSQDYSDSAYICRCERVTVGEIRQLIRAGVRDINQIKAVTKASMGACGGKTCLNMIRRLYQLEGVPLSEVTDTTIRPVFIEMPMDILANVKSVLQDKNEY